MLALSKQVLTAPAFDKDQFEIMRANFLTAYDRRYDTPAKVLSALRSKVNYAPNPRLWDANADDYKKVKVADLKRINIAFFFDLRDERQDLFYGPGVHLCLFLARSHHVSIGTSCHPAHILYQNLRRLSLRNCWKGGKEIYRTRAIRHWRPSRAQRRIGEAALFNREPPSWRRRYGTSTTTLKNLKPALFSSVTT